MTLIIGIIGIAYILLIGLFIIGFNRIPTVSVPAAATQVSFSIIIPFRDEALVLPRLLKSLEKLAYPNALFEIILINDASTDNSLDIIADFIATSDLLNVTVIANERVSQSPKKDAITTAIAQAQHSWILTTDADCIVPIQWLRSYNSHILQTNALIVAGPITLLTSDSTHPFLNTYEILDVHSLLGATIGGFGIGHPFMANGANLAYHKETFLALNGFEGNNHLASGDDIFMLEKIQQQIPKRASYLKNPEAIVATYPQIGWKGLLEQRIRWAGKATGYSAVFPKGVGLVVLLGNLASMLCIVGLAGMVAGYAFAKAHSLPLLLYLCSKFLVDGILIWKGLGFTNSKKNFLGYPIVALLYPFVSVYVALRALGGSYHWKGRQFNR